MLRKAFRYIFIAVWGTTIMTASAKKTELTPDNATGPLTGTYYVVNSVIDLGGRTIILPVDGVIELEPGGAFRNGTVNVNRATVVAPAMQIFYGTKFTGAFGNDEVKASWFGPYDENVSTTINDALKAASANIVQIGGGTYNITKTINLNIEGQRLACANQITYTGSEPAIEVSAPYTSVSVNRMHGYPNNSAIKLSGNARFGRYEPTFTMGFDKCIDVSSGSVADNIFEFQWWYDTIPISVDMRGGARFERNTFRGGRLSGNKGVYYISKGHKNALCNLYDCIGFEAIDTCCIELNGSSYDRFTDLRMNESFPDWNSTGQCIKLENTGHAFISTKGTFIADYIHIGDGCSANLIDMPVSSANFFYRAPQLTVAESLDPYPNLEHKREDQKYTPLTTFNLGAYNMVNSVTYTDETSPHTTLITLLDLLPETHRYNGETQKVLGNLCHVKVGRNQNIVLRVPVNAMPSTTVHTDFDIIVDLVDNTASFGLQNIVYTTTSEPNEKITVNRGPLQTVTSGTYRLTWTRNVTKDNGDENENWSHRLIRIL